jgi:5-methylcytosine-specific restriction endonuclease McrA
MAFVDLWEVQVTTKTCKRCEKEKPIDDFPLYKYSNTNKKGEKIEGVGRRGLCRPCRQAQQAENYARVAGSVSEYRHLVHKRRYANDKEYRERVLASNKRYAKQNPEKMAAIQRNWRANNPEHAREMDRKWREANPEKQKEASARYYKNGGAKKMHQRAMLRRNVESDGHTISEMHDYWRSKGIDPKRCAYCDAWHTKWTYGDWKTSVGDHIVPLTRGGKDVLENMNPCCRNCNSSKGNRILYEEWIPPKERIAA